jgi:hypothetical protein
MLLYTRTIDEIGLDVNAEKTKYSLLSRHQNAGQNHDINKANRKCDTFQILGNDSKKLKFGSGGN